MIMILKDVVSDEALQALGFQQVRTNPRYMFYADELGGCIYIDDRTILASAGPIPLVIKKLFTMDFIVDE